MRTTTRACATAVAALGLAAAPIAFAGSAFAVDPPYEEGANTTLSTSNPGLGEDMTVAGTGMEGGEGVKIEGHSVVFLLATVTADAGGSYTATVTMPAGFTCAHKITATGQSSGRVTSNDIVVGDAAACAAGDTDGDPSNGNNSDDGDSLPGTGAAVAGLILVGAALVGGGVVLKRGARRKVDASV